MHLNWEDYDEPTRRRIAAANPELQAYLDEWDKSQVVKPRMSSEEFDKRAKEIEKELMEGKYSYDALFSTRKKKPRVSSGKSTPPSPSQ